MFYVPKLNLCFVFWFNEISVFMNSTFRHYEGWNFNSGNYLFTTDKK